MLVSLCYQVTSLGGFFFYSLLLLVCLPVGGAAVKRAMVVYSPSETIVTVRFYVSKRYI